MSDAKVTFQDVRGDDCSPGQEQRFSFQCPKNRHSRCSSLLIAGRTDIPRDGQNRNGGRAQWDWNGNREAPTFSPSINCDGCWHGYIEKGRAVDCNKQDEPEPAGREQT